MGTTLTGTTPQDTYDSLIKVTDNGPLSGTAKYLSDGLGNDSVLALSTSLAGIGKIPAARKLEVQQVLGGNAAAFGLFDGSGTLNSVVGSEPSANDFQVATTAGIRFYTGSTIGNIVTEPTNERMRITSAGNVGIGTTNIPEKLSVAGNIRLSNTSAELTLMRSDSVSPVARIRMVGNDNADKWEVATNYLVGGAGFEINNQGNNRLFITQAGNVGIGTDLPADLLHVRRSGNGNALIVANDQTSSQVNIGVGVLTGGSPFIGTNTNSNPLQIGTRASVDMIFVHNSTERVRVTSNGLTFNGDTAAANALDDYEEGAFTPTMAGATFAYTIQSGFYTKIGRQVSIFIDLEATYSSPTGTFSVNLPFTVLTNSRGEGVVRPITGVTFTNYVTCEAISTSLFFENCFTSTGGASTDMNSTNFNSAGFRFFASVTFFV